MPDQTQDRGLPANPYNAHCWVTGQPAVGPGTWVGAFTLLDGQGGLHIGRGCNVSCGAQILTHSTVRRCVSGGAYGEVDRRPTVLEDHVFVGTNAVVLMGCRVGHHSVLAAGTVLLEGTVVPPYSLVAGVPGRVVRSLEGDAALWSRGAADAGASAGRVRHSVVTAFFNEADNLPAFRARLTRALAGLGGDWEIVLVDDHSSDSGPALARRWVAEDARVRYVRLARNCGAHAAFSAGLAQCTGDCAVLLAADLQDPPEAVGALLERWRQGYDVVWANRTAPASPSALGRLFARAYYGLLRRCLPGVPEHGADFLLLGRPVIDAYNGVAEKNTSFLAMILWLGFRQTHVRYAKEARRAGRSKWTLAKKVQLALDSLVSFTSAPIRLMSLAGLGVGALGLAYGLVVLLRALAFGVPVAGWSSLMVVLLVLGGMQLLTLGTLGEYLWRAFDQVRGRPRYLVEERVEHEARPGRGHRRAG